MKKILVCLLLFKVVGGFGQETTLKEIANFPEDYLGKTFTFKNIWWYPTLVQIENKLDGQTYYQIMLDISGVGNKEFELGAMSKIMGVTTKSIAKQLTTDAKSGYDYHYFGDVTGKVVKTKTFGSDYLFVLIDIVHHTPAPEQRVIAIYK